MSRRPPLAAPHGAPHSTSRDARGTTPHGPGRRGAQRPPERAYDDEYDWDYCPMNYTSVSVDEPLPVHTGVLRSDGAPIYRHPLVPRVGFAPPDRAFHAPSMDGEPYEQAISGWVYES